MRVLAYCTIVINNRPAVYDDIGSDCAPGLDNSTCHDLDPIFKLHFSTDSRRRMNHASEAIPRETEPLVDSLASC